MIRCICNCIDDKGIKEILNKSPDLNEEEVIKELCIGASCGMCLKNIDQEIKKIKEELCPRK